MEKLKSRKLWVSILAATMVIVGNHFGVPPKILLYAAGVLASYVGVQGGIDLAELFAIKAEDPKAEDGKG